MFILSEGRTAFLEFLRNLTAQAVLFSTAALIGTGLDIHRFDMSNWANTLACGACWVFALSAAWANVSTFLDALTESLGPGSELLSGQRKNRRVIAILIDDLKAIWKRKPRLYLDIFVTIILGYVSLVAVLLAASSAMKAMLR